MADTKTLTPDEVVKLKTAVNGIVVGLQNVDDMRASIKDIAVEVAEELELKASDVMDAAKVIYKQNITDLRDKQEKREGLLSQLGYDFDEE